MSTSLKTLSLIGGSVALALALSGCAGGFTVDGPNEASGGSSESSTVKSGDAAKVLGTIYDFGSAISDSAGESENLFKMLEGLDIESDDVPTVEEMSKHAPYLNYVYFDGIEDKVEQRETMLTFVFVALSFQNSGQPADVKKLFKVTDESLVKFDESDPKKANVLVEDGFGSAEFPMISVDGKWFIDGLEFRKLMLEIEEVANAENQGEGSEASAE